jgi:hypothetical protein
MSRICSKCKQPIRKHDRWRLVRRRFWFLTWERPQHHRCDQPTLGPPKPRDPREVPLPFPAESDAEIGRRAGEAFADVMFTESPIQKRMKEMAAARSDDY